MKKAVVKYPLHGQISEGVIIESADDLKMYAKRLEQACVSIATKLVKSPLPLESADHLVNSFERVEKGLLIGALASASLHDRNVVFELPFQQEKVLWAMQRHKEPLFVNKMGGFCPVKHLKVLESEDCADIFPVIRADIKEHSKFIVLENDMELEATAIDIVQNQLDANYSSIIDLRGLSKSTLSYYFRKFKKQDGESVYVYTTAWDVDQMYEYSILAINAGLRHFVFTFNSGVNEKVQEFLRWLTSQKVTVRQISKAKR